MSEQPMCHHPLSNGRREYCSKCKIVLCNGATQSSCHNRGRKWWGSSMICNGCWFVARHENDTGC